MRHAELPQIVADCPLVANLGLLVPLNRGKFAAMKVLFTKENASQMAKLSHAPNSARHLKKPALQQSAPESQISQSQSNSADDHRRNTLRNQIELLDYHIARTKRAANLCKLIAAKARLWELLYPKPGSLRPGKQRGHEQRAPIEPMPDRQTPQPIDAVPALVASSNEANHNEKTDVQNPQ